MSQNFHFSGGQLAAALGRPLLQALRRALGPTFRGRPLYARYLPVGLPSPTNQDEPGHPCQNLAFTWDPTRRQLQPVDAASAQRVAGLWTLCVHGWWSGSTYSWTLCLLADGWQPPADALTGDDETLRRFR